MKITFVSYKGKHTVTVNGEKKTFPSVLAALAYIYDVTGRNK